MGGVKVVVYGLSTEGYTIASQMAIKGADVYIIDESTPSAISLKAEIAKTYPNVSSLKEDEPLLVMEPIDVAISKAEYLFFSPRIRKTGQDTKTEIHSKFKDAVKSLKKNSSVIFTLPTGFGGNNENILLLEHVTGFEVGKNVSYFYYPLEDQNKQPETIGSFNGKEDSKLYDLLTIDKKEKRFVAISSAEHFHAIKILSRFSSLCCVLEVCKYAQDEITKNDLSSDDFQKIFLDEMVSGLFDIKCLGSSFEGTNTLMYLINGSVKGIDGYIKRLIDEIRITLKKNDLKASRTKIALSWTLDQHAMRGDKIEMLQNLTTRLRDYIGDVEAYEDSNYDLFHSDKTTIVVACSKTDFEHIEKTKQDSNLIVIKANPLCETI
ncbi:hypothetical protein HX860_05510 [Marine Group I thaumarchaeote]|uniref:UDP-glucose/GDP-mannose dehydrogenase family protein n=1 Tax=Marine Group I thaumarchaeote TaxID=2511932 RepID=A0A7K4MHM5_9ARCH|nr:MAG: hypothetical protein DSN69_04055 [Nitrosopumilus sp. YT1]NMI82463.1 hypothetical protein [Candidatus Nitrosopumilus sp. MTA1]NWJ20506.1 hypothetical protein [Marine Group I thaumarchaeote]NWJ28688.1 hypothetical protein [Marine Group I thaumarchaeote]NWJ56587.1 hypothetical protein [Marine Group I thaumarchaeote]